MESIADLIQRMWTPAILKAATEEQTIFTQGHVVMCRKWIHSKRRLVFSLFYPFGDPDKLVGKLHIRPRP